VSVRNKTRNKHQIRTEETQAKILRAAEVIFSEQGFEKTQLEEIAARAGYTRGAIYAHYADKEDLFLALMQNRVMTQFTAIWRVMEAEPEVSKRPGIFKRWIASQAKDRNWCTLNLEFKLYVLRRPRSRAKLLRMYDMMRKLPGGNIDRKHAFIKLLFGENLDKTSLLAVERRLAVMGAILGAVILESYLRPKLLSQAQLPPVLEELYDALVRA
jgi:AcrR family transcriptional regulator